MDPKDTPPRPALALRFRQYLGERFPLGPYALLIAALVAGTAAALGPDPGGPLVFGWPHLAAFGAALLFFFHLRVLDEFKDYEDDCRTQPERPVPRGLISLRELALFGALGLGLQLALVGPLGGLALTWWLAAVGYSLLMRWEFFVGAALRRHIVLYALTHNPVVALLVLFVAAGLGGAGAPATATWAFVAVASFTSLGFELGRKLRAPADERPGVETYSAVLGPWRAGLLLGAALLAATVAAVAILWLQGAASWAWGVELGLGGLAVGLALRYGRRPSAPAAKAAEAGASLLALGLYLTPLAAAALRGGLTWLS